ncbi:GNAT family N-acetyltransferase [Emcibacter sp. SYSU 3D8]|uniref:GNAT family N-acetyltransferase n=1 Tax=Emcibacter sp. SYSU 3D8 TaxID=3133969 RepID=UPI0031FF1DC2
MKPTFETERLVLRPQAESDTVELMAMGMDPEVMQYIGYGAMTLQDSHELALETLAMDGPLGRWIITDRETGLFLGWVVLIYLDGSEDIEVGYGLKVIAWNRGFATEATRRLLDYGFEELGLKEIVAVSRPENIASHKVLEKAGMRRRGLRDAFGLRGLYYFVARADALVDG